jgi:hypothetical protein
MSAHPAEHQDLLARILSGDLAEGDEAALARLAACPECREELRRLRSLDARLRAAAGEARGDVERARSQVLPADAALVRGSLRAALSAHRSTRLVFLACAAGLLVLLGLGAMYYLRSSAGPAEILLRGGSIHCFAPVDAVDDYDEFSWSWTLPPQGRYELSIRALQEGKAGDLLKAIPCDGPRWIPTPDEKRALPDGIQWFVEARDVSGRLVGSGWAKAWRRSR